MVFPQPPFLRIRSSIELSTSEAGRRDKSRRERSRCDRLRHHWFVLLGANRARVKRFIYVEIRLYTFLLIRKWRQRPVNLDLTKQPTCRDEIWTTTTKISSRRRFSIKRFRSRSFILIGIQKVSLKIFVRSEWLKKIIYNQLYDSSNLIDLHKVFY